MINKNNKKTVDKYMSEREDEVLNDELSPKSLKLEKTQLILLLEFTSELDFNELPKKFTGKSFKSYLNSVNARRDGKTVPLSKNYKHQAMGTTRRFFSWLKGQAGFQKVITTEWIAEFNYRRKNNSPERETKSDNKHGYFTLDELLIIAKTPVNSLVEERLQASIVFLFLSGMRISAFLTLPIHAVDLTRRIVYQYPEYGVQTKLGKKRKTKMLFIPELLPIVSSWDAKIRSLNSLNSPWFVPISSQTGLLAPNQPIGSYRDSSFRKNLATFMEKAGLPYRNPHQLRHGYIRYARDRAPNNVKALEIIANSTIQTVETMLKYAELDNNDAIEEFDKVIINDPENMPGISVPSPELNKLVSSLVEQNQELLLQLRHTQKLLLQLQ